MSKNWKDKGWVQMSSMLDEALPVSRKPLLPLFPASLRIATLVLFIIGSAYWSYTYIQSASNIQEMGAFDFNSLESYSAFEKEYNSNTKNPDEISKTKSGGTNRAVLKESKGSVSPESLISLVEERTSLTQSTDTKESTKLTGSLYDQANSTDIFARISTVDGTSTNDLIPAEHPVTPSQSDINQQIQFADDLPSLAVESANEGAVTELSKINPIVHPKLKPFFSVGASAGNYTFTGPTMYGQVNINMHIPINKSFNLTVLAAAGKGLLYQNTEVLLAEYSENSTDQNILGSEAPSDDLSAFVDVKSVANVLVGTQLQCVFSEHWSFSLGADVAYAFDIRHQAIQSTSLLPEGQLPQQIFTNSEITEKFSHWNLWDFRVNAALQYHMTRNWSLAMSYHRGFTNLLKHPLAPEHNIEMNSLSLGLNYKF